MKKFTIIIFIVFLFTIELFSFSFKGRYIGERLNPTANIYTISKDMYFVDGQDTITIKRRLKGLCIDNGSFTSYTSKPGRVLFIPDYGIYSRCFLTEGSVYELELLPVSKALLSEISEKELFYYKYNCIFPDSADNLFYEIRSDVMDTSMYAPYYNMYVDIDNRLYKIQEVTPNCDCSDFKMRRIEIPYQAVLSIKSLLDSLYGNSNSIDYGN